jgi:D-alanine-D-alanine ligase-like ATP-grasp enzyme
VYYYGSPLPDYDRIVEKGEDLFVKPATAGSSIGVSKVHNKQEFGPAIKLALRNSDIVLIEKAVEGRNSKLPYWQHLRSHIE